jgi:hypothetical protein
MSLARAIWGSPWFLLLFPLALALAVAAGRWLAQRQAPTVPAAQGGFDESMFVLLALLLGFTFAMSGSNYRETVLTLHRETEAIREAHRWGRLLDDADRKWFYDLLRAYVDAVLRVEEAIEVQAEETVAVRGVEGLQTEIWRGLVARRSKAADRSAFDSCLGAVNKMREAYHLRSHLLHERTPGVIIVVIVMGALLTGLRRGHASVQPARGFWLSAVLFVVFVSGVMYLIWDLEQASEGLIAINEQPLIDLADWLKRAAP